MEHRSLLYHYTVYIYRERIDLDPQVNQAQRPSIPLHCIYIERKRRR